MKHPVKKWISIAALISALFVCVTVFAQQVEVTQEQRGAGLDTGDPVSASNGSYHFTMPLLNLGGLIPLRAGLTYHMSAQGVDENKGISHSFLNRFQFSSGATVRFVRIYLGRNGDVIMFASSNNGPWTTSGASRQYYLQETGPDQTTGYYYLMDPVEEKVFIFEKQTNGVTRQKTVIDRNDNLLTYDYGDTSWIPQSIYEGDGAAGKRRFNLAMLNQRIASVTEVVAGAGGRTIGYDNNATSQLLERVIDPAGNPTVFIWQTSGSSLITGVTRPAGNTPYTQTVDFLKARVTSQTDAYANKTDFTYNNTTKEVTEQRPDGNNVVYVHYGNYQVPKSLTDPSGKQIAFSKTTNNQTSQVTDRRGDSTGFTYHPETGKLASITNAAGGNLACTYTAQVQNFTNPANGEPVTFTFYDLTRIDYPDGTNEQAVYDGRGNPLTRIDRAGKTWTFTYNAQGQVLTMTNPTGGVRTFTYNADATPASSRDSDTGIQTYGYDTYKRVNRITRPDGKFVQLVYDLNDRLTSVTDENNHSYTYEYDVNGNLVKVVDPNGNPTQYGYDLLDRLIQQTDRLGKVITRTYDNMNRLLSETDPNGLQDTYGYDPRGWLNSLTRGGQAWQTGYDDEGLVSSQTTPQGLVTQYQTDKLGNLTGVTDPLSQTTTYVRDALGRVTGKTDPLSRNTAYGYDGRGLLSSVTPPAVGTATYQRNDLGRLSRITDLNGRNWSFGYSAMGRLTSITDPLGRAENYAFDTRGRLTTITYPDGSTQTITYDDAGNIIQRQFSDGLTLQYTYDALNRLLTTSSLSLTRDAEGRVNSTDNPGTIFGATYDDGGRLKTATYNNGLFTVTYTYDAVTGLLSGVTDSLTAASVAFSYDSDRQLTGIARANGVNAQISYDAAGRLIRIRDGSIIDLQYTLNAAGEVGGINQTVPLDPAGYLQAAANTFTYDDASQVNNAGYAYDPRGRMTTSPGSTYAWDGASRLTSHNTAGLTYNGLGDLITRTEGGTTIHYYYNRAIGLNPIVAEKDETGGSFLRYYVWTPSGSLLYMIDGANSNKVYYYHFDRIGSTLALTDSTGAVTDSYAYSPSGELLGHTGASPQPFTFVGRWGVRQEGTSGKLSQMRARFYSGTTGRFLSPESIWPQLSDPRAINPYQYALNSPLFWVDLTGQESVKQNDLWYLEGSSEWQRSHGVPVPRYKPGQHFKPKFSEKDNIFFSEGPSGLKISDPNDVPGERTTSISNGNEITGPVDINTLRFPNTGHPLINNSPPGAPVSSRKPGQHFKPKYSEKGNIFFSEGPSGVKISDPNDVSGVDTVIGNREATKKIKVFSVWEGLSDDEKEDLAMFLLNAS